jgi:hypothetical protein
VRAVLRAASKVLVKCSTHIGFSRLMVFLQQFGRADQDAGDAVTTLRSLLIDKGLLQGTQFTGLAQAFHRDDGLARCRPQGHVARRHRHPIYQYMA